MDPFVNLLSLGSVPFGDFVGGLTALLLVAATALGIAFERQDAAIVRELTRLTRDPAPAPGRRAVRTPERGKTTPRLVEAPARAG